MTEALANRSVYLETNFFIKAVEGTEEAAAAPKQLIALLRARPGTAVTSEITFAETLAPPKRADALPLHIKRRVYLDLLLWSGFILLIPVNRDILIETADLRTVARLKLPDAIHLVSAMHAKCQYLVSNDDHFKKLPTGMEHVKPDDAGIEKLVKVFT
jgi:predicted nucleic acid-binding protein